MTYDLLITDSHVITPKGMVEKNIVVEKPMALNTIDTKLMIKACNDNKIKLASKTY